MAGRKEFSHKEKTMDKIRIENYGQYSGQNYGVNSLCVTVGAIDVYFSYKTPVAVRLDGRLIVRQNDWNTTTGKHLNWIDGGEKEAKARRLPSAEFETLMASIAEQTALVKAII